MIGIQWKDREKRATENLDPKKKKKKKNQVSMKSKKKIKFDNSGVSTNRKLDF